MGRNSRNLLYINTSLIPTRRNGILNTHHVNEVVVSLRPVNYHDVNVVVSDDCNLMDIKKM